MKPEINAAAEFLSRIFLAHDNITTDKVTEFKQYFAELLEARFRNHWHETCPTKGQAYRCIRVCPEEPLDRTIRKVCNDIGIAEEYFNMPIELTLWVDPKEVICKIGDLKCSYHTVAKNNKSSGVLDNQTENLDIEDMLENARELYHKKQTVVIHPIHSTEMHIQNPFSDGTQNGFTMAVRMNGTMHYNLSSSPPTGFNVSPRGKNRTPTSAHKRSSYNYYKASGGKGQAYVANGTVNANSGMNGFNPQSNGHSHHHHGSNHQHQQPQAGQGGSNSPYQNGYLNGYLDETNFGYDVRSTSPTKMNGLPPPPMSNGHSAPGQINQTSPTPEQIQQQMQHPPPFPPPSSMPPHLQAYSHPPADTSSVPPPPIVPTQSQQPPSLASSSIITSSATTSSNNNSSSTSSSGTTGGKANSKFQVSRGVGGRHRQSPVKDVK